MEFVHRYGGVVEHPIGSALFAVHGRGGWIEKVNQHEFAHPALKPTLLYWFILPNAGPTKLPEATRG
jgi:hypothetical protein